jgi:hypothetical protein
VLIRQVALVADTPQLKLDDVTRVAAALQKQATRDFGPIWNVDATVDGFARLEDVPLGYWPILVGDEGQGGGGVHLDKNNQPYALVDFTQQWTLAASHECMEMLADPFGNRTVAGDSLKQDQGRVEYLLEVCDPCEAPQFGYTCNGVLVSDFYTPHFFDPPAPAGSTVQYSFQGNIKAPRQVLSGGYISWHDPVSDHWWQQVYFGNQPEIRDLGGRDDSGGSLREWIDRQTLPDRMKLLKEQRPSGRMLLAMPGQEVAGEDRVAKATQARAAALRKRIEAVRRAR